MSRVVTRTGQQYFRFDQRTIPTPVCWFDGSDSSSSSMTLTGSTVTQWKDKSGTGNNTSGSNGSPTLVTNSLNGLSGVSFDGASNYAINGSIVSTDWSIFVVLRTSQITGSGNWPNGAGIIDASALTSTEDWGASIVNGKWSTGISAASSTTPSITGTTDVSNNQGTICAFIRRSVGLNTASITAASRTTLTLSISAASRSGTTITYTTNAAHNLFRGYMVTITGLAPSGYNVTNLMVTAVPSPTTFQVIAASDPGDNTDGTGTATTYVITYTTSIAHGFLAGQRVVTTNLLPSTGYNLTNVMIGNVPTTTTFTVGVATDPGANTDGEGFATTNSGFSSFVNGILQGTANGNSGSKSGSTSAYIGRVGKASPAVYFNGIIYEILIYNCAVTTRQRQQIEGYLAGKWGILENLSLNHVYRTIPTTMRSFMPTDIPDCIMWFDPSDTSTVTTIAGTSDGSSTNGNTIPATNDTGVRIVNTIRSKGVLNLIAERAKPSVMLPSTYNGYPFFGECHYVETNVSVTYTGTTASNPFNSVTGLRAIGINRVFGNTTPYTLDSVDYQLGGGFNSTYLLVRNVTTTSENRTMFYVMGGRNPITTPSTGNDTFQRCLGNADLGTADNYLHYFNANTTEIYMQPVGRSNQALLGGNVSPFTGTFTDGRTYIFAIRHVQNQLGLTANNNTNRLTINGRSITLTTTQPVSSPAYRVGTNQEFILGTGPYYNRISWIGEALYYDRALSDQEMIQVEGYLAIKWRMSLASATNGLPATHPFYNNKVLPSVGLIGPPQFDNLSLWLDATDSSTLFSDSAGTTLALLNGLIGQWRDKSGLSNNAIQSNSANAPTYVLDDGNPALYFSKAASDHLLGTSSTILNSPTYSVFIVCRSTTTDLGSDFTDTAFFGNKQINGVENVQINPYRRSGGTIGRNCRVSINGDTAFKTFNGSASTNVTSASITAVPRSTATITAAARLTASITSISNVANIVTYTTNSAHGFSVGTIVTTTSLAPATYNVTNGTITAVPTSTTFVIILGSTPSSVTDGVGTATSAIITYTTSAAHGISVGQSVTVTGLSPSGYNVTNATVTAVPTSTTFRVNTSSDPGANTVASGTATISSSVTTYTTSAAHGFAVGQSVSVTGLAPSGYNVENAVITAVTATNFEVRAPFDPGTNRDATGTATLVATTPSDRLLLEVLENGSVGTTSDAVFYENGNLRTITSVTGSGNGTTNSNSYIIGASNTGTLADFLEGYVYEVVVYPRLLTPSERQQIESYLTWKWKLQTNLPSFHPYRLTRA